MIDSLEHTEAYWYIAFVQIFTSLAHSALSSDSRFDYAVARLQQQQQRKHNERV